MHKHRFLALTDFENEPDDTQSLVRLLLYGNEIDLEGFIAVTSTWLRFKVHPDEIHTVINGYAEVYDNLKNIDAAYPSPESLHPKVKAGIVAYGMKGVGQGCDSEGSDHIIAVVDKEDELKRPVDIGLWGGANCLAQALWKVRKTRSAEEVERFTEKIRVYGISDQDDAGPWIRRNFPMIQYIVSVHAENLYPLATWQGFSSCFIPGQPTPFNHMVQAEWLKKNVQEVGPLGKQYPDIAFAMEGDTVSYMACIPNGMNDPSRPDYGGWGGRYGKIADEGSRHYHDAMDKVVQPETGETVMSPAASIWRWREHIQNDFAERMQWTVTTDAKDAHRPPKVVVDGDDTNDFVVKAAKVGEISTLDASASFSPNGHELSYHWIQYIECGSILPLPGLDFQPFDTHSTENTPHLKITLPQTTKMKVNDHVEFEDGRDYHLILQVTDKGGKFPLTRYRRVILRVDNRE